MASVDQSLISDPEEKKWVVEIKEILNQQLENEIDFEATHVSIFEVPQNITKQNPEAYEPQHIGLGPNHHFRAEPYRKMEQKKIAAVQRVLQYNKIKNFELTFLHKVRKLVPVVRACYDSFLQDDNVSLAWVFAIDCLYLLDLFHTYERETVGTDDASNYENLDPAKRLLAQDIMMVENQVPFVMLKEIDEALHPSAGNDFSPLVFRSFIEIHSPLELCSPLEPPTIHVQHLLDYMYQSIINNTPTTLPSCDIDPVIPVRIGGAAPTESIMDLITQCADFVNKVPVKQFSQFYEQSITTLKIFTRKKTTIPSASKLEGRARFRFQDLEKDEGVQNIHIESETFYLPCVTLTNDSEVILRNLVAYEMLMPNNNKFPLTEYVGLLCGLIVSTDDVKLLKKAKIIKGDLGDDEIVKLFVGMTGSILSIKTKEKSKLQKTIDIVNKVFESSPRMKAYLVLQKLASWLLVVLTAIGNFVGATWKIVAFMVSIVTVFMLTYQAYCEVYGCDKTNVSLLSYASS